MQEMQVRFLGQEDPLEKEMTTSVFFLGEFHGQRSLVSCSPWGYKVRKDWMTNTLPCPTSILSDQLLCSVMSDSLQPHELQHAVLSCLSPIPGACSNSSIKLVMPSKHLNLCRPLLLLPSTFASTGTLPMSQFFSSGGQILQLQYQSFQWIFRTDFV